MMSTRKRRIMVIGLDGASFQILTPYLASGVMPTLSRLMAEGVHTPLRSVLPTISAGAWSSFMTGKNPGKHAVFAFEDLVTSTIDRKVPVSARSIRARVLWDILREHGKNVAVFNVPMTYPPTEVNGFIVSGMMTPQSKGVCAYPEDLGKTIAARFPDYRIDIPWATYEGQEERFFRDLMELTRQRRDVTLFLMGSYDWDFFQVVFVGPDRIQHPMMKYIAPDEFGIEHDSKTHKHQNSIEAYFHQLDESIREILANAGRNTLIIIMSDHGFMPAKVQFRMNEWLAKIGALQWRVDSMNWVTRLMRWEPTAVRRMRRRLKISRFVHTRLTANSIDWSKTEAFSTFGGEHSAITINLMGRQPGGTVPSNEYDSVRALLRQKLEQARDPKSGLPVARRVFFKEELYQGPYLDQAPDIVMEPALYISTGAYGVRLFEPPQGVSGVHDLEGILIAYGPELIPGKSFEQRRPSILDLTPTMLYYMGIPIPEDMDGRVMVEMFSPEFVAQNPIVKAAVAQDTSDSETAYEEAELNEVEDRLRSLGYL